MSQQNKKPEETKRISIVSIALASLVVFFLVQQLFFSRTMESDVDTLITSEFVQAVEQDRVVSVVYNAGNYTVSGKYYSAATAGSSISESYNDAINSLNSANGEATDVETETIDPSTLGTLRNYTSTFIGQDALMSLLADHPNVTLEIQLPSEFLSILS